MFHAEEVNGGRQPFLDVAKTLAVLCMVHLHLITYMLPDCSIAHPGLYLVANWFTGGVFAAPVFMFCMGIGMTYSRHSQPEQILTRGLKLYKKAWVLNILRAAFLWMVLWLLTKRSEMLTHVVFFTTFIDILQFAAMAFFLTALLRRLKMNDLAILGVGVALSVAGSFLRNRDTGSFLLNFIFGHFVGITPASGNFKTIFPLFNWYIIVAAGRVFGVLLRRCSQVRKWMLILLCTTAPLLILYNVLCLPSKSGIYGDITNYYYMDLPTAVYALTAVLFMLSVCFFICRVLPKKMRSCCQYISIRLNEIYCFHWIIILNLFYILGSTVLGLTLDTLTLYPATIFVSAGSILLAWADERFFRSFFKRL